MQYKLILELDRRFGDNLPFNYQYEQSAVIYRILSQADERYSSWLHENGYVLNGSKRFKLFSYSPFIFERVRAVTKAGCLNIIGNYAVWYINFIPEKSTTDFIKGVFEHKSFTIGNKDFKVAFNIVGVESLPPMSLREEMRFSTLSPVCVKQHEGRRIKYLSPDDSLFAEGILKGLMAKYESYHGCPCPGADIQQMQFIVDNSLTVKSKVITIKANTTAETKVKGFLFNFKMKMPAELMEMAIEGGIGEECSQGFGFIKAKR